MFGVDDLYLDLVLIYIFIKIYSPEQGFVCYWALLTGDCKC